MNTRLYIRRSFYSFFYPLALTLVHFIFYYKLLTYEDMKLCVHPRKM
jgi:hypothetical protein